MNIVLTSKEWKTQKKFPRGVSFTVNCGTSIYLWKTGNMLKMFLKSSDAHPLKNTVSCTVSVTLQS